MRLALPGLARIATGAGIHRAAKHAELADRHLRNRAPRVRRLRELRNRQLRIRIELGDPAILGFGDTVLELVPETEVQREVLRGAPRVLEEPAVVRVAHRDRRVLPDRHLTSECPSMRAARLGPMLLAGNTAVVSAARVNVLSNVYVDDTLPPAISSFRRIARR